jgi:hypothetical protein
MIYNSNGEKAGKRIGYQGPTQLDPMPMYNLVANSPLEDIKINDNFKTQ